MKKSEQYKELASQEDNDLIAMGHMNKALREERTERFEENWLEKLSEKCDVTQRILQGCHTFTIEPYGTIDYYPKANKLLIRKDNKWIKPGLKWIVTNIINGTEQNN